MRLFGWALIQCDWCPYKKRKFGSRHTKRDEYVKTQGEEGQGEMPQRKPTLSTPCYRTSSLQNCETINFCGWSRPVCGIGYGRTCRLTQPPSDLVRSLDWRAVQPGNPQLTWEESSGQRQIIWALFPLYLMLSIYRNFCLTFLWEMTFLFHKYSLSSLLRRNIPPCPTSIYLVTYFI